MSVARPVPDEKDEPGHKLFSDFLQEVKSANALEMTESSKADAIKVIQCVEYIKTHLKTILAVVEKRLEKTDTDADYKFPADPIKQLSSDKTKGVLRDDFDTSFHIDAFKTVEEAETSFRNLTDQFEKAFTELPKEKRLAFASKLDFGGADTGCMDARTGPALIWLMTTLTSKTVNFDEFIAAFQGKVADYPEIEDFVTHVMDAALANNYSLCTLDNKDIPLTRELIRRYAVESFSYEVPEEEEVDWLQKIKKSQVLIKVITSNVGVTSNLKFLTDQLNNPEHNRPIKPLHPEQIQNRSIIFNPKRLIKESRIIKGPRGRSKNTDNIKSTSLSLLPENGRMIYYNNDRTVGIGFDLTKTKISEKYIFRKNAVTDSRPWIPGRPGAVLTQSVPLEDIIRHQREVAQQGSVPSHNEIYARPKKQGVGFLFAVKDMVTDRLNALNTKLFMKYELGKDLPLYVIDSQAGPRNYSLKEQVQDLVEGYHRQLNNPACQFSHNFFKLLEADPSLLSIHDKLYFYLELKAGGHNALADNLLNAINFEELSSINLKKAPAELLNHPRYHLIAIDIQALLLILMPQNKLKLIEKIQLLDVMISDFNNTFPMLVTEKILTFLIKHKEYDLAKKLLTKFPKIPLVDKTETSLHTMIVDEPVLENNALINMLIKADNKALFAVNKQGKSIVEAILDRAQQPEQSNLINYLLGILEKNISVFLKNTPALAEKILLRMDKEKLSQTLLIEDDAGNSSFQLALASIKNPDTWSKLLDVMDKDTLSKALLLQNKIGTSGFSSVLLNIKNPNILLKIIAHMGKDTLELALLLQNHEGFSGLIFAFMNIQNPDIWDKLLEKIDKNILANALKLQTKEGFSGFSYLATYVKNPKIWDKLLGCIDADTLVESLLFQNELRRSGFKVAISNIKDPVIWNQILIKLDKHKDKIADAFLLQDLKTSTSGFQHAVKFLEDPSIWEKLLANLDKNKLTEALLLTNPLNGESGFHSAMLNIKNPYVMEALLSALDTDSLAKVLLSQNKAGYSGFQFAAQFIEAGLWLKLLPRLDSKKLAEALVLQNPKNGVSGFLSAVECINPNVLEKLLVMVGKDKLAEALVLQNPKNGVSGFVFALEQITDTDFWNYLLTTVDHEKLVEVLLLQNPKNGISGFVGALSFIKNPDILNKILANLDGELLAKALLLQSDEKVTGFQFATSYIEGLETWDRLVVDADAIGKALLSVSNGGMSGFTSAIHNIKKPAILEKILAAVDKDILAKALLIQNNSGFSGYLTAVKYIKHPDILDSLLARIDKNKLAEALILKNPQSGLSGFEESVKFMKAPQLKILLNNINVETLIKLMSSSHGETNWAWHNNWNEIATNMDSNSMQLILDKLTPTAMSYGKYEGSFGLPYLFEIRMFDWSDKITQAKDYICHNDPQIQRDFVNFLKNAIPENNDIHRPEYWLDLLKTVKGKIKGNEDFKDDIKLLTLLQIRVLNSLYLTCSDMKKKEDIKVKLMKRCLQISDVSICSVSDSKNIEAFLKQVNTANVLTPLVILQHSQHATLRHPNGAPDQEYQEKLLTLSMDILKTYSAQIAKPSMFNKVIPGLKEFLFSLVNAKTPEDKIACLDKCSQDVKKCIEKEDKLSYLIPVIRNSLEVLVPLRNEQLKIRIQQEEKSGPLLR